MLMGMMTTTALFQPAHIACWCLLLLRRRRRRRTGFRVGRMPRRGLGPACLTVTELVVQEWYVAALVVVSAMRTCTVQTCCTCRPVMMKMAPTHAGSVRVGACVDSRPACVRALRHEFPATGVRVCA